ncbi:hypothetical protein JTB14_006191 [Gonioctena quinquepunctata]|nr:hypothetical protein JTB14_006191 [Gonioctena quinquepunctata]
MTKLQEWLSGLGIMFAIWLYMISNREKNYFVRENYNFVFYSPVIFVVIFGVYAASVVLYRVYTFNDCPEAANELQIEIQEAKKSLTQLGFKFRDKRLEDIIKSANMNIEKKKKNAQTIQ